MKQFCLFWLTFPLCLPASRAVTPDVVKYSEWTSSRGNPATLTSTSNVLTLSGTKGRWVNDDGSEGTLKDISYTQQAELVLVKGNCRFQDQPCVFKFIIAPDGERFDGKWDHSLEPGVGSHWNGRRNGTPDPIATALPTPNLAISNTKEWIRRHAQASFRILKSLARSECTSDLLYVSDGFATEYNQYDVTIRQTKESVSKQKAFRVSIDNSPRVTGELMRNNMLDAQTPCEFLQDFKSHVTFHAMGAVENIDKKMKKMQDALQGPTGPTLRGRIVAPTLMVSDDEVVVVDSMALELQQKILAQVDKGLPETVVNDGVQGEQVREQTWGDENIIGLKLRSGVVRPTLTALETVANASGELFFVGRSIRLFSGRFQNKPDPEVNRLHMTGTLTIRTPQGEKVVKTIDHNQNTSFENPEQKFLDNVEFYKFPIACVPTPIGPACIEGSLVGSFGAKPYGARINPGNVYDFNAYYRPYSRIEISVFGGLEYGVAHAGVRGNVSVLNGTVGLLAGKLRPNAPDHCVRVEADELSMLSGMVYADIKTESVPDELVVPLANKTKLLCNRVKDSGSQVMDIKANIEAGLGQIAAGAKETGKFVSDTVGQVAQAGEDLISQTAEVVSNPVRAATSVFSLAPYNVDGNDFLNSVNDLVQMDCDKVIDRLVSYKDIRILEPIYNWEGVVFRRNHKWYEACTTAASFPQ